MGKHTADQNLQAKAEEFDAQHAASVARAGANALDRDATIEALKASNGDHYRKYRRPAA